MIGKLVPSALLASALFCASANGETWAIDSHKSSLTVHVFKSGLLSAFGDNHVVRAAVASGSVTGGEKPGVEIAVDARQMTVLDPDLAKEKRAEVQKRMLGPEVLDVVKFPEIRFKSTAVKPAGDGRWRVEGVLDLRGKSVPLSFEVTGTKERVPRLGDGPSAGFRYRANQRRGRHRQGARRPQGRLRDRDGRPMTTSLSGGESGRGPER